MKITSLEHIIVNVSNKTNWFFIRAMSEDGIQGLGEATLSRGWEMIQLACLDRLRPLVVGKTIEEAMPQLKVYPHSLAGLSGNSIVSAVEQALTDMKAHAVGVPIHALLGKTLHSKMRIYANINRMTNDRSPEGFARSAKIKVNEGLTAIKCAPFDHVFWPDLNSPEGKRNYATGIDRVFAVREAVGPNVDVMIDCHWRFDESSARAMLNQLEPAKLFWAECVVSERPVHHAELRRVRTYASELGVRLAGVEKQVGYAGLEPFIEGKLLDVVMPDLKYSGGYSEMMIIAERAAAAGIEFSPHNPSGPVCTFGSLHLCSTLPNFLILEHQTEGTRYKEVLKNEHPVPIDGCFGLPAGIGLGLELNMDVIDAHPYQKPRAEAWDDPRLG